MPETLVLASPRSGTAYITEVLKRLGKDAAHETRHLSCEVLVDWRSVVYCVPSRKNILQVRDPLKTIASLATINGRSRSFAIEHVPELQPLIGNPIRFDSIFWLRWVERAYDLCDFSYRVEDIPDNERVFSVFCNRVDCDQNRDHARIVWTGINARPHKQLEWSDIERAAPEYYPAIRKYAFHFGYRYGDE